VSIYRLFRRILAEAQMLLAENDSNKRQIYLQKEASHRLSSKSRELEKYQEEQAKVHELKGEEVDKLEYLIEQLHKAQEGQKVVEKEPEPQI
jgi:thymidylate synthase